MNNDTGYISIENEGVAMDTKRPTVVTIAAILLVILALFVAGLGLAGQFGLLRRGGANRQFASGQFRNRSFNLPNGGTNNGSPQGTFPNGGNGTFPNGGNGTFPNDQNGTGTTNNFPRTFTGGTGITGLAGLFRFLRPVTIGLDIALLLLAGLAAFGIFKGKRWGQILAIVIAVLLILLAIPSFIRIFSAVVLIENLVRILLAVAVIVLLLLPNSRKVFAKAEDLELDDMN
jgi:hypothetical protein